MILVSDASCAQMIVPGDIDDLTAASGGNVYDRRLCRDLARLTPIAVEGEWPVPGPAARAELQRVLADIPAGTVVLLDGLVACGVPEIVVPHAARLRLGVIVHLPLAEETGLAPERAADLDRRERTVLRAAAAVIATSPAAALRLTAHHGLDRAKVRVVPPGTDPAPLASGGGGLLCVASITPRKGQDLLLAALAMLVSVDWRCELVGSLTRDPRYAAAISEQAPPQVRIRGPLAGADLDAAYDRADLLVLPSRSETYGMVLAEALARGIPVLATAVDGVAETIGHVPDGVPGLLVPPDDPAALAAALRRWYADEALRRRLRDRARQRRLTLTAWDETARRMQAVLDWLWGESA